MAKKEFGRVGKEFCRAKLLGERLTKQGKQLAKECAEARHESIWLGLAQVELLCQCLPSLQAAFYSHSDIK